jgi:hypothetical protein
MSINNLSNELFFNVHRGVNTSYPHYPQGGKSTQYKLDMNNFGTHWSADQQVAKEFANSPNSRALVPHWRTDYAHVIHAEVPMSSVETDTETMKQGGFANFSRQDPTGEEEVMVKKGAPLKITGVTNLRRSKDETAIKARKRTFNPPREMKA